MKSERPRRQRWWSTRAREDKFTSQASHQHSWQAASSKGPSFGWRFPVRESHQKTSRTITTTKVTSWKSGQLMLDTNPHSDFWALQETHLPGIEQMAAANSVGGRPGRKGRGRAQGHQFERADGVRVDVGRGGGSGTRRRGAPFAILAMPCPRKTHSRHAQARRHSDNGLPRARHACFGGSTSGFWRCWRPAYFDGPWIAMGDWDWNMEPKDLAQAGWLETVNGKVATTSAAACAGGVGAVLDYFVLS